MLPTNNRWKDAILPQEVNLRTVLENLVAVEIQIVLITSSNGKLIGTINDGDIRRAMLKGLSYNDSIEKVIERSPTIVKAETNPTRDIIMKMMLEKKIRQIPICDYHDNVVGLYIWEDLINSKERDNIMIIMAGGKGARLMPHTKDCPKPMLPVAGKPILTHIIERAKADGFKKFVITTSHLGHMIENYYGNGDKLSVDIKYIREKEPLGNAGALAMISPTPDKSFIVTNGDILTDVRYADILEYHIESGADGTMAIKKYEWQNPYGVVETNGKEIIGFQEKPINTSYINAGVYAFKPKIMSYIIAGQYCEMPYVFEQIRQRKGKPYVYLINEPWIDVGTNSDLKLANENYSTNRSQ